MNIYKARDKISFILFLILTFSLFNIFLPSTAVNATMQTCPDFTKSGFGAGPIIGTVALIPAGKYETFEVELKDDAGNTKSISEACMPPSNTVADTNKTNTLVRFQNIAAGYYKLCYKDTCTSLIEKKTSGETLKMQSSLAINVKGTDIHLSNTTLNVIVNLKIEPSNNIKSYSIGLIILKALTSGQNIKPHDLSSTKFESRARINTLSMKTKFENISPGLFELCLENIGFCKKGEKTNVEETITINLNEDQSKLLLTKEEGQSSCDIDGIGWIICPAINFLAKISDGAYTYISEQFLAVKVETVSSGDESATFSAWSIMRNFANVAFVIAFLIIILSQLSGLGITNYGIKKLLPKIIIAAILVNLSYYICQIAVDVSNIVGKSLSELFPAITPTLETTPGFLSGQSWANIAGGALVATAGVGIVWANLAALIPVLISAVVALVMILFILVARQAIIILLVVISPLAFVSFLLPNTEQWFKKWQKTLTAMLLLYPIVALIYGVSGFASTILSGAMQDSGTLGQIAAASVMVLPLFVIPGLLKKSLDSVGNIGGVLNNLGGKLGGAAGKKAMNDTALGQAVKYKDQQSALTRAKIQSGTYEGQGGKFNPRNLHSRLSSAANNAGWTGNFGNRRAAQGAALVAAENTELLKNASSRLDEMQFVDSRGSSNPLSQGQMIQIAAGQNLTSDGTATGRILMGSGSFDTHTRQAAMQKALPIATVKQAEDLVDASGRFSVDERKNMVNLLATSSAVKKAPYLGGANLANVASGTANTKAAAIAAISKGGITSEVLANGDADSTQTIFNAATTFASGSAEVAALKSAVAGIGTDPALKSKIAPGLAHDINLNKISLLP